MGEKFFSAGGAGRGAGVFFLLLRGSLKPSRDERTSSYPRTEELATRHERRFMSTSSQSTLILAVAGSGTSRARASVERGGVRPRGHSATPFCGRGRTQGLLRLTTTRTCC